MKNYKQICEEAIKAIPADREALKSLGRDQKAEYLLSITAARRKYVENKVFERILNAK